MLWSPHKTGDAGDFQLLARFWLYKQSSELNLKQPDWREM